ncbi:hypothetical protein [Corynebacterium sp.]|uniref:hypothetical protein n=1 Tax=Corynebacterium sp. TaxID=1720 RepID=UPI0028B13947|nr:hypothetical protein [Corynebacterium sp.]
MNDLDILKVAIEQVQDVLGDEVWVADCLPPADEFDECLPAVCIDLLPGDEVMGWGGDAGEPLGEILALDVEVVARSRAQATPVAHKVRMALHQLPHIETLGVRYVECPRFSTREDINPQLRVLGAAVDIGATSH